MDVTGLGIVIEFKLEQPWNALLPIEETVLGIAKVVKPEQPSNALLPIDLSEPKIEIEIKLVHE